jgi:UDP-N-acetylglucosamine--N-acetylmuramyl-(pentapeptide) pyrophosphoryl-undecaprenol N-acetylglucosamine transferase
MTVRQGLKPDGRCFYFAGGGTGGHIYPALAVAEQIVVIEPQSKIHFFCSSRSIDERVLGPTGFERTILPARGLSLRGLMSFCRSFLASYKTAKRRFDSVTVIQSHRQTVSPSHRLRPSSVVVGAGGYVSAPVCLAAHRLKIPVVLLNVDIIPGRANRLLVRWADEAFVQFEETASYFLRKKVKATVVGCPLRSDFGSPDPAEAVRQLNLNPDKRTLLITGASSGAQSINRTVCSLLKDLDAFAGDWQIVHLTGRDNQEQVARKYAAAKIERKVIGYFDNMPSLLAAADLLIGRSGAVSVAEYAAAAVPSICMPYPHHKDMHQYLNAGKLVEAGAAIVVDDLPDEKDRAEWLWEELEELMKDKAKRDEMAEACRNIARTDAASKIAERLLAIAGGRRSDEDPKH